jgi:hypothetical protein
MRHRNKLSPGVECVEQRLSLSALGASPALPAGGPDPVNVSSSVYQLRNATIGTLSAPGPRTDPTALGLELENTLISNFSASTPQPGGSQQIIAILIGG